MRLVFVNWAFENHGSAQDLCSYARVARALGHEVTLFGPPTTGSAFDYSLDVSSADAVVFAFEFTTYIDRGNGFLDYARLVGKVPRERRVVIDCDGKYNDAISIVGDTNHPDAAASRQWVEICDSLSDKICQPTPRPLRPNVRPFFFHAYNPAWESPLDFSAKDYGMMYIGTNWFRWRPIHLVLQAIRPIRAQIGRIGLVGHGWDTLPADPDADLPHDAYYTDPGYLKQLGVEVMPPIPVEQVIGSMSQAVFNPVLVRPLFNHLGLVTCRTFETPAANTIPLFAQDASYVEEIYGGQALELVLRDDTTEQILDVLRRPDHYATIVSGIRQYLAEKHSYAARLQELIQIVES